MKNLKKPTRDQKERMAKAKLDPTAFLVKEDAGGTLIVVDKISGKAKAVEGKVSRSVQ